MNTAVLPSLAAVPASLSEEALARESARAQAALRRRRWIIISLRLLFLFVVLGGWSCWRASSGSTRSSTHNLR